MSFVAHISESAADGKLPRSDQALADLEEGRRIQRRCLRRAMILIKCQHAVFY
jgi:hypothetical protein